MKIATLTPIGRYAGNKHSKPGKFHWKFYYNTSQHMKEQHKREVTLTRMIVSQESWNHPFINIITYWREAGAILQNMTSILTRLYLSFPIHVHANFGDSMTICTINPAIINNKWITTMTRTCTKQNDKIKLCTSLFTVSSVLHINSATIFT